MHLHLEHSDLICIIFLSGIEELDLVTLADGSVHNLEICDDSSERIEYRVKDKGLERCLRITLRSRNSLDDGIQNLFDAFSGLARSKQDILSLASDKIYHLVSHYIHHSRLDIDLIQHRDDFQIVLDGQIKI